MQCFIFNGTSWITFGQAINIDIETDTNSSDMLLPNSISLNNLGDTVAVGLSSSNATQDGYDNTGLTSIFKFNGISWIPIGTIAGEAIEDYSGTS
ncbi:hypothetical protein EBR96_10340, partial [bacterium]|nr:hypothetical protein [bacterium]